MLTGGESGRNPTNTRTPNFYRGGGGEETIQTVKNIRVFNNVKGKWGWVGVANTSKQQNTQMETL